MAHLKNYAMSILITFLNHCMKLMKIRRKRVTHLMEDSKPSPIVVYLPSVRCFLFFIWHDGIDVPPTNSPENIALASWRTPLGASNLLLLPISMPTLLKFDKLLLMIDSYVFWGEIMSFSTHGVQYFVNICIQDHLYASAHAFHIINKVNVVIPDILGRKSFISFL